MALVTALAVAPAAAQSDDEEFLVELDAEGNADVTVTFTYDLESDGQRAAFGDLQANTTAQAVFAEQFETRVSAIAADASEATNREMAVTNVETTAETVGNVGVITLTFQWVGLAEIDGDQLTVIEPFASGFEPDRTFTVEAPDGYEISSATPNPSSGGEASTSWAAGTSFAGFELVAEHDGADDTDSDGANNTDGDGAGFSVAVTVSALLAVALVVIRQARS